MNTFAWLLKREFWEHRGGFFWAPIIVGVISLVLFTMGIVVGEVSMHRANVDPKFFGMDAVTSHLTGEQMHMLGTGLQIAMYTVPGLIFVVTFFVLFFYCLGALYDDRKDRSVLFWKSLPLSNLETVASKAVTALLVVPLISTVAAIATGLAFLVLLSAYVGYYGMNPITLVWLQAGPWKAAAQMLAYIPLAALWALPSVGWLMLCSAWARSKPFLWALAIPIGLGIMVSWFDLMQSLTVPDAWFWKNVVARLLLSLMPGSWLDTSGIDDNFQGPDDFARLFDLGNAYAALGTADLWIGAVAGLAMLAGAVYFRRKRDEG
ncbi:hypothetical protein [Chiayiivirga flava]|uniref:ABC-2 type transport system permease protein n=1 Tax=Chiayiivirga flava TaxID=659595 RepID=A0A7W8FZI4_9GAMM|nr:hypothetical protein [Chiayiivirga flava]MBB5206663.1 ABC-2 type transport system permease protein [Chiayiivirga flava]